MFVADGVQSHILFSSPFNCDLINIYILIFLNIFSQEKWFESFDLKSN